MSSLTVAIERFTANSTQAMNNDLDAIGYKLLNEKQVSEDTEVFQLNVTQNPTAWNPYDSLEQAYTVASQKTWQSRVM